MNKELLNVWFVDEDRGEFADLYTTRRQLKSALIGVRASQLRGREFRFQIDIDGGKRHFIAQDIWVTIYDAGKTLPA